MTNAVNSQVAVEVLETNPGTSCFFSQIAVEVLEDNINTTTTVIPVVFVVT